MMKDNNDTISEKWLEETLQTDPGFSLPDNFSEMVSAAVSRRLAWISYMKEFLVYLTTIFGIAALSAGMSLIWFQSNVEEWSVFILSNLSWVIGGNILIVFVLFADRVLLRYYLFKSKSAT